MVHSIQISLHEISSEIARWKDILAVPDQEYLLKDKSSDLYNY